MDERRRRRTMSMSNVEVRCITSLPLSSSHTTTRGHVANGDVANNNGQTTMTMVPPRLTKDGEYPRTETGDDEPR